MDFRTIFDTIPEAFDRLRPRYSEEAFRDLVRVAGLCPKSAALEIGPGTGQATEPVLATGADYLGIELGQNFTAFLTEKFRNFRNFRVVNADFETYDFGAERFDLVLSAAAIQWIPEEIGFYKSYRLLNPGGTLAMLTMKGDFETPNKELYDAIQKVYAQYFHPEYEYAHRGFRYENALNYGFTDFECREYHGERAFDADGYVEYIGTHSDHLALTEPDRSKFFAGVRAAILEAGDRIVLFDTITLYTAKKPN